MLNLFATPLVIATRARTPRRSNAELKRIILEREAAGERIGAALEPRRLAIELGPASMGRRADAEGAGSSVVALPSKSPSTARANDRRCAQVAHQLRGPTSTVRATATSSTRIPARCGRQPTTSTTAAVGADPSPLGGEFEIRDPQRRGARDVRAVS